MKGQRFYFLLTFVLLLFRNLIIIIIW